MFYKNANKFLKIRLMNSFLKFSALISSIANIDSCNIYKL